MHVRMQKSGAYRTGSENRFRISFSEFMPDCQLFLVYLGMQKEVDFLLHCLPKYFIYLSIRSVKEIIFSHKIGSIEKPF